MVGPTSCPGKERAIEQSGCGCPQLCLAAWHLGLDIFDWAAQPFTVVTTFIFGPYFISRMAGNPEAGQVAWGYGFAAAGFLIAVLSPILGAVADRTGARKPWIAFSPC